MAMGVSSIWAISPDGGQLLNIYLRTSGYGQYIITLVLWNVVTVIRYLVTASAASGTRTDLTVSLLGYIYEYHEKNNMPRFTLSLLLSLLCLGVFSQDNSGISHQAVIRNNVGELVTNSTIGVKVSIMQGSATGIEIYSETHLPVSNAHRLITYIIGHGTIVSGIFENINWSDGSYFLKTEVDPIGGTNYSIEGTTQFHSVPYALHSQTSNVAKSIDGSVSSNIQAPTCCWLGVGVQVE